MDIGSILILGTILLAALLIPWSQGLMDRRKPFFITVFFLAIAFSARAYYFDFTSGDYNTFLVHWVDYYRHSGGFAALDTHVGNYNVPYHYFLAAFSHLDINDLYLIKMVSVAFDVVLAFAVMKLTSVFTASPNRRLAAYLGTLLLPTVLLNGAKWGQCDSIYVAFAALALWLVLSNRPIASMVCIALSFAFKLQAIFIMPLYLVLLFAKRVKIWHFVFFPLTYIALMLPAIFAGRPVKETLLFYLHHATSAGTGLNYNSPSVFALIKNPTSPSSAAAVGIAAAFIFVFAIFTWAWIKRKILNNEALLLIGILFSIGIPFLLPYMHDRYFFMADVLLLVPALLYLGLIPIPILCSAASLICYYNYFKWGVDYIPLKYGAVAILCALLLVIIMTASHLNSHRYAELK